MTTAAHANRVVLDHSLGDGVTVFVHGGKSTVAAAITRTTGPGHIDLEDVRLLHDWLERSDAKVLNDVQAMMPEIPARVVPASFSI